MFEWGEGTNVDCSLSFGIQLESLEDWELWSLILALVVNLSLLILGEEGTLKCRVTISALGLT